MSSFCCCSSFIFCSSFCCFCSYVILFLSLLFNVIPHPSVNYRRVFTPILYFQLSPSQSDSRHFHFQPYQDLLFTFLPRALRFWVGIFHPEAFFTLRSFTDILLAFIEAFLGARSSSLRFAGYHTDLPNIDPVQLFFRFTVIHTLHV